MKKKRIPIEPIYIRQHKDDPEMLEIITYPSWSKRPRCDVLAVVHRDAIDACLTTDAKEIIFDQRAEAELFIGEEQIYCDIELP